MRMWQSDKKTLAFEYEFSLKQYMHTVLGSIIYTLMHI